MYFKVFINKSWGKRSVSCRRRFNQCFLKVHGALLSDTVTSREFVQTNSISAIKIAEKENRVSKT